MIVFVVNCGSSSIKFQLFDMGDESVLAKGMMERVGTDEALLHLTAGNTDHEPMGVGSAGGGDHRTGLRTIVSVLVSKGVVASVDQIEGVGHRGDAPSR